MPYAAVGLTVRGTGTTAGTWDFDDIYAKQVNQSAPVLYKNTSNSLYAFSIQNAAGSPLLVADTSNFEVRIGDGDNNPDATPTLLVIDHKSTSGDPTGYNGAMYYNAIAKKFRCYEGDTWKDCISTMLDPRLGYNYQSEFTSGTFTSGSAVDANISVAQSGGSFAQQNNDGGSHPGILGATVSSTTSVAGYAGATTNILINNGDWSYLSSIKLNTLSASGGIYTFRAGFLNAVSTAAEGGITNGCYLRYTDGVNSGNWQGVCRSASTESTCNVAVAATTSWTTLNVTVSGNGTAATFTVNDTSQCTITSNIPTVATSIGAMIQKATGGTTVQTVPYKMNFQGRLTDASGNIKPDGLYNMKIRLFNVASGGTSLGEEVRDSGYRVEVKNGLFSIQIGDNSVLSPAVFTNYPLYIEIELPTPATATCATAGCGTWTEGPMSPRSGLASTPTTFNADVIDGIDGSSMARKDANNTFTAGNVFNGKTQLNDTLSVASNTVVGFNVDSFVLQNAGTGAYLTNDYRGLSLSVVPSGSAGSAIPNPSTLRLVANNNLVQARVSSGVTYGDNLIANPGFEFGTAGWRYTNGDTVGPPDARTGAGSLRVQQPAATALLDSVSNLMAVTPGDSLYYGGYVRVNNVAAGSGGYLLIYYDAQGNVVNYSSGDAYNGSLPDTSYNFRAAATVVPAGAVYVEMTATMRGDGSVAGTWYFDDTFVQKASNSAPTLFKNLVDSASAFVIQNAGGGSLLVADTLTNTIRVGGGPDGADPFPARLVVDNKTTSGDPTGRNGSMYYNMATKKFRCYEDGGWKDCITSDPLMRGSYALNEDFLQSINVTSSSFTPGSKILDASLTAYGSIEGSVVTQASETNHPGIIGIGTGGQTNGSAFVSSNLIASNPSTMYMFGSGAVNYSVGVKVDILSTSGVAYGAIFGLSSNPSAPAGTSTGCYFRYTHSLNGGRWTGACASAGAETTCDLGVTVDVNKWYNLQFAVNSSGTAATFVASDDTNTYTCPSPITTNITTTVGQSVLNGVRKTTGNGFGTTRTFSLDYLRLQYDLPNR
ncbi:hypothetical protein HY312_01660 [Candidatus Saccharibacteria bacterium]|nr:hypothetical protein [Candidatus Saccharibacteria bacterium]